MKIVLLASVLLVFACKGTNSNPEQTVNIPENNQVIEVSIEGMTCAGCENTIQSNISQLDGISHVKASHSEGNAIINFDPERVDTSQIKEKIIASGYKVVAISNNSK